MSPVKRIPIVKFAGVPCPACKGNFVPPRRNPSKVCEICQGSGRVVPICREHPLRTPRCPGCQARLGGLAKTPALAEARRRNGRLGGRPRKNPVPKAG